LRNLITSGAEHSTFVNLTAHFFCMCRSNYNQRKPIASEGFSLCLSVHFPGNALRPLLLRDIELRPVTLFPVVLMSHGYALGTMTPVRK
jgi:hypothetical protein